MEELLLLQVQVLGGNEVLYVCHHLQVLLHHMHQLSNASVTRSAPSEGSIQ